jgi:hypothetical protein
MKNTCHLSWLGVGQKRLVGWQALGVSAHVSVSAVADAGVHELLARHAGHLSGVPLECGQALAGNGGADRDPR